MKNQRNILMTILLILISLKIKIEKNKTTNNLDNILMKNVFKNNTKTILVNKCVK